MLLSSIILSFILFLDQTPSFAQIMTPSQVTTYEWEDAGIYALIVPTQYNLCMIYDNIFLGTYPILTNLQQECYDLYINGMDYGAVSIRGLPTVVVSGGGYVGGLPCPPSAPAALANEKQQLEQYASSNPEWIEGNTAPGCNTQGFISNNPSQLINGPVISQDMVPTDKMTLTNDPINIATGEAYFSSKDFLIKSRGPKLSLFRKYRSFSTNIGMFGYGWRTDYDINLSQDTNGNVTVVDWEGTVSYFMNIQGAYIPSPFNTSTIIKNGDNTFTVTDKYGIVTHYDINGRLSSRTDRNGNTLTFVYNPSVPGGTYIQDASGRQIVLNIDSNGHVASAVDPVGKTFQYGYDTNGNLVSITAPTGAVTNYTYDSNHKIIQFTNANGHNTYYQYDSQGQAISTYQDNNVNKVSLNYANDGTYRTTVTDSLGNKSYYVFNSYGLMTSYTDSTGAVTTQVWDNFMNLTSRLDARNNQTNFSYDGEGNLIKIIDPLNNSTTMTYTSNFNLISSRTDVLGNTTNYVYDINGNLTSITDALGNTHSFIHDQYGNLISATDSRGNTTNFIYDPFGHVIQKTDALGNNTNFTYE